MLVNSAHKLKDALIIIPIAPQAKERPRFSKFHTYTPAKTRAFENAVKLYIKSSFKEEPFSVPLKVVIEFHLDRPKKPKFHLPAVRPDMDNYVKAVLDACNEVLWTDDSLICSLSSIKIYAANEPKIVLFVEEI